MCLRIGVDEAANEKFRPVRESKSVRLVRSLLSGSYPGFVYGRRLEEKIKSDVREIVLGLDPSDSGQSQGQILAETVTHIMVNKSR